MANARLKQLDYYALLKVERTANSDEIRRAFHRFAAKYHPDKFVGQGAEPKLIARAAEVYRRGAEAYRVLCDSRQRKLYDAGLSQGRLRFDPSISPPEDPSTARFPVRVKNPAARPFATQAERAYKAQDWSTCHFNLKLALNKDRDNAQLRALLEAVAAKLGSGA